MGLTNLVALKNKKMPLEELDDFSKILKKKKRITYDSLKGNDYHKKVKIRILQKHFIQSKTISELIKLDRCSLRNLLRNFVTNLFTSGWIVNE